MTTLNLPRIAELLALNAKRTQGDWFLSDVQTDEWDCQYYTLGHDLSESVDKCHYEDSRAQIFDNNIPESEFHANAELMRSAPELAEHLRLAVERIAELESRIANGNDNGH